MPRRTQTGGALKKIGSLTPTITSPETMAEQCQFQLLFAHGSTIMNQLMIVPKDTFLLFLGPSGYYNYPAKMNKALVLANMFRTIDAYYKNMYDNFFSKEDVRAERPAYPYPSSQIYTPGDIIHDINLSFYSDHKQKVVFFYGYHTLPITETPLEANDSIADPLTNHTMLLKSTQYVPYVLYLIAKGNIGETLLNTFQLKPEVKDEFDRLVTGSTFNAIDNGLTTLNQTKKEDIYELDYWFTNPDNVMKAVITPYEQSHPNNQYNFTRKVRTNLSTVLQEYPNTEIGSPKQYRFIMIQACRGPDVELGTFHNPSYSNWNRYRNLPPSQLTLASVPQKLARRMSFSAKQSAEVCPLGVGAPPMNLASVKKAMEDIAPHIKEYTDVIGGRHEHEFLRLIYESFFGIKPTVKVRIVKKGELLSYATTVNIRTFLIAIDRAFQRFPLLESKDPEKEDPAEADPEKAATKLRFQNVVGTFQNMVRAYATSAAVNDPMVPNNTVGEHIMKQISNSNLKRIIFHHDYDRPKIQEGIQTKLLRTNEGIEAIRPMIQEALSILPSIQEQTTEANELTTSYNEELKKHFYSYNEDASNTLKQLWGQTEDTLRTQRLKLKTLIDHWNTLNNTIGKIFKQYPVIMTIPFRRIDDSFGRNDPSKESFTIKDTLQYIANLINTNNRIYSNLDYTIDVNKSDYNRDYRYYTHYTTELGKAIEELTKETQAIQQTFESFSQRSRTLEGTVQRYNPSRNYMRITEETYQSTMEELSSLLKEMEEFDKSMLVIKLKLKYNNFNTNPEYKWYVTQSIQSYAPQFQSPYTNDKTVTYTQYYTIISKILDDYYTNFQKSMILMPIRIEIYKDTYETQQRLIQSEAETTTKANAKGNSTKRRNNRPRNTSMVSGSTTKPKNTRRNSPRNASIVSGEAGSTRPNQTNQTRKKPLWEKRREKQAEKQAAKRNQTKRNGPQRNGSNGLPVIPKL